MLVVGAGNKPLPFTFRDWSEANEVADIQAMDIGMMPLHDDPWALGKCGYKLIQYMACGLPVIASPVGVNRDIVEHGVNGFLASTEQEWRSAIEQLLSDASLRERMGKAGRTKVEAHYSIQQVGPRIAKLIHDLLSHA
jgi:glycosyltransferase involved in cell wall biosynthesis